MNIDPANNNSYPLPTSVIADGKVRKKNLIKLNLDNKWLEQQLRLSGVNSVADVFYAEVQKDGTLYIDKRTDRPR